MDHEIQLISDGVGLAVVGETAAVEQYLGSRDLLAASRHFDTRRLSRLLAAGSDVAQAASEIAANSGRWIKLTEESARLVEEHGLMESTTDGESHLMIGVPGVVRSWLQAEDGVGALARNPAALSSVAGLMAQTAKQQSMAEITAYLARIDEKVDDLLAKLDGTVLKDLSGARTQVRRATTMREHEGVVSDDAWSEVQDASGKIAGVQAYALGELERLADKLESKRRMGGLADAVDESRPAVRRWLAVLADCFRLQEEFDVIAIDRVLTEPPDVIDRRRRGLERDRQDRLDSISVATQHLLDRMDVAAGRANARILWTRDRSLTVLADANRVAEGVSEFHTVLGIESDVVAWEPRQLVAAANVGAHAIQGAKDVAPVAGAAVVVGLGVAGKKLLK